MANITSPEDQKKSSRIQKIKQTISLRGHFVGWLLAPVVGIIFFPSVILITLCMLPTIVSYIAEKRYDKHASRTVGYLNIAATFGLGWQLWTTDNSIQGAMDIISNLFTLTLVYSSALVGWIIYYFSRSVVDTYLQIAYEIRIRSARHRQVQLAKEWGPDVGEGAEELFHQSADMTQKIDSEIAELVQSSETRGGKLGTGIRKFTRRFFNIEGKVAEMAHSETMSLVRQQQQEIDEQNLRDFELNKNRYVEPAHHQEDAPKKTADDNGDVPPS